MEMKEDIRTKFIMITCCYGAKSTPVEVAVIILYYYLLSCFHKKFRLILFFSHSSDNAGGFISMSMFSLVPSVTYFGSTIDHLLIYSSQNCECL